MSGFLAIDHLNKPEKKVKLRELHLLGLKLTEVTGTQVSLLFGSDVTEIIVPLEIRHGPKGSLLVLALGLVGLLLVVYLVISKSRNLFVKFMCELQTRSSMKP